MGIITLGLTPSRGGLNEMGVTRVLLFDTVPGKGLFGQQLPAGAFRTVLSVSFPSQPQPKAGSMIGCGISQGSPSGIVCHSLSLLCELEKKA